MKRPISVRAVAVACVLSTGCGGANASRVDPQSPMPAGRQDAPSRVVICPDGSNYDPSRNVCVAVGTVQPGAASGTTVQASSSGQVEVSVSCTFANGWVALVPEDDYPEDDSFIMQALIGLTEEPDFWTNESEYSRLRPYAAKRCTARDQQFRVSPGAYFVLAGEAGTFARRGGYSRNGYKRRVDLSSELRLRLRASDLTHSWDCISCPYVAFMDPQTGRWRPAFVILERRSGRDRRGTDRINLENVAVERGVIRLRVVEVEPEVTHLDELVLRVAGQTLTPSKGGAGSALAEADGVEVEMSRGSQIEVEYAVPGLSDGVVSVELIAHGHYDPTES